MNYKENVERDNVIYHGTQQEMGFNLVFFRVLWSILVLQTLRQFAHIFSFRGVESKLSSISVKCDTYPNLTEHKL
jgi:hypothetical protein